MSPLSNLGLVNLQLCCMEDTKFHTFYVSWGEGPQCFWSRGRKRLWVHTWPFQPEWQSWAGLMEVTFPRALPTLPGRALSGLYTGGVGRWKGGGGRRKTSSCYGHVCISKIRREDDKRITVDIFSLWKDTCVMLPCIVTFADQRIHMPRKS